jgi:DNA (cytosine-5)-methyltransferase 1
MKYLSLFSGVGGFELGIERAYESLCNANRSKNGGSKEDTEGNEGQGLLSKKRKEASTEKRSASERNHDLAHERPLCIGFSEIDKYAIKVYQHHFPNHKNYGDITKIIAEELPDFDLLVGGSPCQDLSIAGKRAGMDGERSGLFAEYVRILKAKKPQHFIWENVKGALSSNKGWDFVGVIGAFTEAGYDCQWQVLNAKDFGVPQNRERIFVVGTRGTPRPEVFPFGQDDREVNDVQGQQTNTLTARYEGAQATGSYIVEGKLNAQKEINQLNPLNTMQGGNRQPFVKVPEATKKGYAEATEGDSINLSVPNSKTRRGRVGKGIAQTLDTGMHQHTLQDAKIRRLTPLECERLMSFPDNWTNVEGMSDTQRYKQCGNGVVSNVVQAIIERMI